jgi:hypothetical protein
MAEHVFESPLVEEFYNSCHLKSNGKFCGAGTKGRVAKRVPMSDAARASNAAIRGKAAKMRKKLAAKQAQSKGAMEKMSGQAAKVKTRKEYGSGKTEPGALKLTQKYGTRQAPRPKTQAGGTKSSVKPKATPPKSKEYGSGKTEPNALALTKKYGTRGAGTKAKAPAKYKDYGSGKTDPDALSLTKRFGARRG